jgi:hypothetical protein
MKKVITLLATKFFLSGCGTMITVPIDSTPLTKEKSTLIVYHEQGFTEEFKVFLDRKHIGQVTSEKPLKIAVEPGKHDLYVEFPVAIDRITTQTFEKGETYYMKIWFERGMWVSSIRIDPSNQIESYKVRIHRQ